MRGIRVIQAGEQAFFQGRREVCIVGADGGVFGVSLSLSGLTWCQRTLSSLDIHQQYRSSFRLETLGLTA